MGSSIAVNHQTFAPEVLEKSFEKPVLVDFFAQWCGPCQMLKPMLEKLVQEYDVVLAKVDIDANPDLAQQYGVQGVPDVRIVMDGRVYQGFVGVLPEPQLRELLTQLSLKSQLNELLEAIYTEAAQGQIESATAQLNQLLQQYPDNRGLLLEAANFHIQAEQLETAEALLAKIQESDQQFFSHAKSLKAMIQFKRIAAEPASDSELEQTFQAAIQLALAEDYEASLSSLLTLVSQDRRYREDGARKAMLSIFELLGDDHALTRDYRKRLMLALY